MEDFSNDGVSESEGEVSYLTLQGVPSARAPTDWGDSDLDVSPSCPIVQTVLPKSHQP